VRRLQIFAAASRRARRDGGAQEMGAVTEPLYDYSMVDSDFFLPIVAADYLARASRAQATAF